MPDDPNVFDVATWERELGPARGTRVGAAAGARDLGCALYELTLVARRPRTTCTTPTKSC
jgi:hypothetical protein